MLPRRHRLNRPEDFRAVVRAGARVGGRHVVVHLRAQASELTPAQPSRVGLVVGRSVGSAVTRNRVSRRLRAHLGRRLCDLPPGLDIVVRVLPSAADATFTDLSAETDRCLGKALTRVGQRAGTPAHRVP